MATVFLLCALLLFAQARGLEDTTNREVRGESDVTGAGQEESSNIFLGASPDRAKADVCHYTRDAIYDRLLQHDSEMFDNWLTEIIKKGSNHFFQPKPAESKGAAHAHAQVMYYIAV